MKKKVLWSIVTLIFGFLLYQAYIFFLAPTNNLNGIYLVPKDAVIIVETQKPIDNWSDISNSDIWKHLQKNKSFKELTLSLEEFNTVFNDQKKLIDLIGNRSMLMSIHVTQKKRYDLLYIADLQKTAKLNLLKNHLSSFIGDGYKLNKRKYHQHEILEFYDLKTRETLSVSFIENQLIASFTHSLVEHAIDQYEEPVIGRDLQFIDITKKVGFKNMFRLYVQYKYLNAYLNCFFDGTNDLVNTVSKTFKYSGFHFDLKSNDIILADGYTNTYDNTNIYLQALQKSGEGQRTIAKVAPKRTAFYLSFSFDSFNTFYKNFESIQKEDPENFKTYQANLTKIEDFLDINIKKNFISLIDDEIALLQMQSIAINTENELAFVLKINNKAEARTNLDYILKRIKKKTPVKFKGIDYKGYTIQFMSIKGFFKALLGKMFDKIDKPYFTIIDDYIVFSNSPNTIKNIIDDYIAKETLIKSEDYQSFNDNFSKKSSVFSYINTPILYKSIYALADKTTKKQLIQNKDFIICFPQIGFQLTPYSTMFESKFIMSYQDPEIVKSKEQFKDKLQGPRQENDQVIEPDNSEHNENLVAIESENLFKIPAIRPHNLDDDEFVVKYDNGQIHFEVSLDNGVPNGRYRAYYKNGELKLKGRFKDGVQYKVWKAYDDKGNFLTKRKF